MGAFRLREVDSQPSSLAPRSTLRVTFVFKTQVKITFLFPLGSTIGNCQLDSVDTHGLNLGALEHNQ